MDLLLFPRLSEEREGEITARSQPAEAQLGGCASEHLGSVAEPLYGHLAAVRAAASANQVLLLRLSHLHPPDPHGLSKPGWPRPGRPCEHLLEHHSSRHLSWRRHSSSQVARCLPARQRSEHCYRSSSMMSNRVKPLGNGPIFRFYSGAYLSAAVSYTFEHDFPIRSTFITFLSMDVTKFALFPGVSYGNATMPLIPCIEVIPVMFHTFCELWNFKNDYACVVFQYFRNKLCRSSYAHIYTLLITTW